MPTGVDGCDNPTSALSARADGARVLEARGARRRGAEHRRDARTSRADPRPARGRHQAHADPARLGCEGWGGRAPLRGLGRRTRRRAEDRGRKRTGETPSRQPGSYPASGSKPGSSDGWASRTRAARSKRVPRNVRTRDGRRDMSVLNGYRKNIAKCRNRTYAKPTSRTTDAAPGGGAGAAKEEPAPRGRAVRKVRSEHERRDPQPMLSVDIALPEVEDSNA